MEVLSKAEVNDIIRKEYPDADNNTLANKLGIKEQTLRSKASKLGVRKSKEFMKEYYIRLHGHKRLKHEKNYKDYQMTQLERNIIIGSLLGDGSLSKYGRSLNALYRENTGPNQVPYRRWKADKLVNLDFKVNAKGAICSPSHPIYTELYDIFYPSGQKIISKEALKMLNHPIGLACLYMDDGSLMIGGSPGVNVVTIFPSIALYSQSFTREKNILLKNHIKNTFNIKFKLAPISSGSGYFLRIGQNSEIRRFLKVIKPYVNEIPSMRYKIDIDTRLEETSLVYSKKFPDKAINKTKKEKTHKPYSKEDENKIISMLDSGFSYRKIAKELNRSYYSLYDKIRRMRIKGNL